MAEEPNKNAEVDNPPSLESDDAELEDEVKFSSDSFAGVPSSSRPLGDSAATPSNTPVVSLYSKGAQQTGTKRAFDSDEGPKEPEKVNEMLSALNINKGNVKDPGDDEDDEDEEEIDEDDFIATQEQINETLPILKENEQKMDELMKQYQTERKELELKFQEMRNKLFSERAKIIKGSSGDHPALPGFWLDAMRRNTLLSQFVEEHDDAALMFLDDISMEDLKGDDENGFQLHFHFTGNPFFRNSVLTKTIVVDRLYFSDYSSMPNILESRGTEVNWFPDKNLTVKVEIKGVVRANRPKEGKKSSEKQVRRETPQDSFFNFFKTRENKTDEDLEKMNEEEEDNYQREWETDFAIASTFRGKLIPDAVNWYTGDASDSEFDEDEEGDEDEDDEEEQFDELHEEDDEDDDEDDDESDTDEDGEESKEKSKSKNKPAKSEAPKAEKKAPGASEEKPECQQQ